MLLCSFILNLSWISLKRVYFAVQVFTDKTNTITLTGGKLTLFSLLCAARKAAITGLFSETLLTAVCYSQLKDAAASISPESVSSAKRTVLSTKCATGRPAGSLSTAGFFVVLWSNRSQEVKCSGRCVNQLPNVSPTLRSHSHFADLLLHVRNTCLD